MSILPEGEELRRAVKWICENRKPGDDPKRLNKLVEEAAVKFDLSPPDTDFLYRFVKDPDDSCK